MFRLQQGDFLETLVLESLKRGLPLPDVVANAPEIVDESLGFYLAAFYQLDTQRIREGGPIPIMSIWSYADRFELRGDDCEDFVYTIRHIDADYLAHQKDKNKTRDKTTGKRTKTKSERGNVPK